MDEVQHNVMQLESYNRKTKKEHIEEKNKSNQGWNNLHTRLNDVGPEWRERHETTIKELVASLTKCGHQQVENLLKPEKIDKNTIDIQTKMDDMYMTKIDRYEYDNILQRITALEQADTAAAIHYSDKRHIIMKSYEKEYHKLEEKTQKATNIAHEARDSTVSTIPRSTNSSSTRPSKSTMEHDISSLQHSVTDL